MNRLFWKWCKSIFLFFEKTKLKTKLSINYVISHFFKKRTYTTFKINGSFSSIIIITSVIIKSTRRLIRTDALTNSSLRFSIRNHLSFVELSSKFNRLAKHEILERNILSVTHDDISTAKSIVHLSRSWNARTSNDETGGKSTERDERRDKCSIRLIESTGWLIGRINWTAKSGYARRKPRRCSDLLLTSCIIRAIWRETRIFEVTCAVWLIGT